MSLSKGTSKESEVNRKKGCRLPALNGPDSAKTANLIWRFYTQFLLFFQFFKFPERGYTKKTSL